MNKRGVETYKDQFTPWKPSELVIFDVEMVEARRIISITAARKNRIRRMSNRAVKKMMEQ
jgi:hypothetical protein